MSNLINQAKGLSKNPLGIIALFVSFVYALASIILGVSIQHLEKSYERLPLIWFIVGFPVLILGVFLFLVVRHHSKLYSPSDFESDESFFQALNAEKASENYVETKIDKEANILESAGIVSEAETEYGGQTQKPTDAKVQDGQTSVQEESVGDSIAEPSNLDAKPVLKLIDKLVLNALLFRYAQDFRPYIKFRAGNEYFIFDAVGNLEEGMALVEIKYWEINRSIKPLLKELFNYLERVKQVQKARPNAKIIPMIVIVFDSPSGVRNKEILDYLEKLSITPTTLFYDFGHLKREFNY